MYVCIGVSVGKGALGQSKDVARCGSTDCVQPLEHGRGYKQDVPEGYVRVGRCQKKSDQDQAAWDDTALQTSLLAYLHSPLPPNQPSGNRHTTMGIAWARS